MDHSIFVEVRSPARMARVVVAEERAKEEGGKGGGEGGGGGGVVSGPSCASSR